MKTIYIEGSSLDDLRSMPKAVRLVLGFQLEQVQMGKEPKSWKPLTGLGKGITGVREIRIEIDKNIFRSTYVTKFGESIVVLHCWNKKTQKISQSDIKTIVSRYTSAQERFS